MTESLLPVGSVVSLEGAQKKLMIVGISVFNEEENITHDYIGVPYPEGFISSELMFLFNHADIAQVHFLGFVDAEFQAFRASVSKENSENK